MPAIPLSDAPDLTRDEVIARYRERIAADKRIKLYKTELEQLIQDFLTRLEGLEDEPAIRELCQAEIALLEEGYKLSTVAFDYLPKYRKALEEALASGRIPVTDSNSHRYVHPQRVTGVTEERFEHYALTYLKYDEDTYEALDSRSQETNRHRQLNLKGVNPWLYLQKLKELLHSEQKFVARHQAIAIAGLTGRRIGEVIARGRFSVSQHPYLLRFEGHSKTQREAYEIVTLIPAAELLPHIEQFRNLDEIKPLLSLQGEELTSAINQFDVQVNRECKKFLAEIVPPLEGREGVSVHNLRSLWGAIAAYFFCPPTSHEYPFLQHYLGHVMESAATGHYFRYRLVDEQGKFLENRGIYIAQSGELPLPGLSQEIDTTPLTRAETMTDEVDGQEETDTPDVALPVQPLKLTLLPALAEAQSLSASLLEALTLMLESDRYTILLTALMTVTGRSPGELLKSGVFDPLADEPFALSFSATGVGAKSRLVTLVEAETVREGVQRLRQHESVQELRYQPPSTIDSRCQLYVTTSIRKYLPFTDIEEMLAAYSRFTGDSVALLPQKATHPPTVSGNFYAEDKQRLTAIASRLSIRGTQPQIFCALLDWVEATLSQQKSQSQEKPPSDEEPANLPFSQMAQALNNQAHTLAWLTGRIESLEGQLSLWQTERDEAISLAQQSSYLKQENLQLRQDNQTLLETAARFEAARQALLGEQMALPMTVPEPLKTTETTTAAPSAPAKGRRQRSEGKAVARAKKIVEAIATWNSHHADDTWAITRGLLEEGFGIHRQAADEFLSQYQSWVDEIHANSGITKVRAHNRGKDLAQLKVWLEQTFPTL